ncbi:MAG: SoxR reducing system RseC family protein [Pseudomonadota bacterium]
MDSPEGHIVEILRADDDRRLAVIDVDARAACARCAAGKGCGAGLFASSGSRRVEASIPRSVEVTAGDRVAIDLADRALLPAALIVYGWPLAGSAVGALLGSLGPWTGDFAPVAGAAGGLVVAALLASRRLDSTRCIARFRPVVIGRIDARA